MVRVEHNREGLTDNEFNFIARIEILHQERERERGSKFPNEFHEFPTKFQIGVKTITLPIQSFPNSRIGIIVTPLWTSDFHRINY